MANQSLLSSYSDTDESQSAYVGSSPVSELATGDPGDETQRNFRYQHAYGVLLLINALRGEWPYTALWCEQHEDFLAERNDGQYDGYQVKTRKPELGTWTLTDDEIRHSIKRFVTLDVTFPNRIKNFYFVSNTEVSDSQAKDKIKNSPLIFLKHVKSIPHYTALPTPFIDSFSNLRSHCECDPAFLFNTLHKVSFVKGPSRDSFDSEIAHEVLPRITCCQSLSPSSLNDIRDELVNKVYLASSCRVDDPSMSWACIDERDRIDPKLMAKRIHLSDVQRFLNEEHTIPFRFLPGSGSLQLGSGKQNTSKLETKLVRGGLSSQVDTMRNRALSAERHLMAIAHSSPEKIDMILDQVVGVVQGECDEARNSASLHGEPYGPWMFHDVCKRLREISKERQPLVLGQPYECLIGVAGLLTGECPVWWSEKFDVEDTQ